MEQDSYAKINIFLKITGKEGNYHTLFSRFMLIKNFSDTIVWSKKDQVGFSTTFELSLCKQVSNDLNDQNTILKAKSVLEPFLTSSQKESLEHTHIHVIKRIPIAAGLGGGSGNAATFLRMAEKKLEIHLTDAEWIDIAKQIGADVPFFWSSNVSSNVSGIGENIIPFEEEALPLEIFTPPISCHTAQIFSHYRQHFFNEHAFDASLLSSLGMQASHQILSEYSPIFLNDLALSVFSLYPELKHYAQEGWFLSGSGSSFFRIKE